MKLILILFLNFLFTVNWHYNLDEAKQMAGQENKCILLNFSGSDWCGPCIRMHKEIFESDSFTKMADHYLIMVNADFPRMKKDQLPPAQQKLNDAMADQYNPNGIFPLTVLLNADGKILKEWDGFPKESEDEFIIEIQEAASKEKNQHG